MAEPINSPKQPSEDSLDVPGQGAESHSQTLYQQGISAFKAKNYELALARFQTLEQSRAATPTDRLKAQMGLIRVYQQLGHGSTAYARCQDLINSPSPKVRQWASQMLTTLSPPSAIPPVEEAISSPNNAQPSGGNRTGFMPLDSTPISAPVNVPIADPQTGFVPLDASLALPSHPSDSPTPPTPPSSQTPAVPTEEISEPVSDLTSSLFYYERLNAVSEDDSPVVQFAVAPSSPEASQTQPDAPEVESSTQGSTSPISLAFQPRPLPQRPFELWGVQVITAITTVWMIHAGLHLVLRSVNRVLRWVRWPIQLNGVSAFDQPHWALVIMALLLITLASPWLMDRVLAWGYGQRTLSTRQLQAEYPKTLRLLRQICRSQDWQLPELRLIPDAVPLCLSYGWLPRNSRIVVSQGLLENCSEDELMALYSYELAHIANWDLPVLSTVGLLLLLLHTGYWRLALWGDTLSPSPMKKGIGILANGLYGLFWILRKFVLWLSRVRARWADQRVTVLTQRPDLQQQSLVQLTQQITHDVRTRGYLHPLLHGLDILLPLNPQAALSPGSFLPRGGLSPLIAMDGINPYRQWLMANASHPPLGQRLLYLHQQALKRKQPALSLDTHNLIAPPLSPPLLLRQKAPLWGLLLGGSCALGLWFVGGVVNRFGWQQLSWIYQDPSILQGGLLLGLGMGILLRLNTLYPDIDPRQSVATAPDDLFATRNLLPVQGQPRQLEGKLLGPPGLANWLGQELYVATLGGIVKLTTPPLLVGWQALVHPAQHPTQGMGRIVSVSGWQRWGGGLLWLDVAQIGWGAGRASFISPTPQWDTLVGLGLSLWGVFTIFTGG